MSGDALPLTDAQLVALFVSATDAELTEWRSLIVIAARTGRVSGVDLDRIIAAGELALTMSNAQVERLQRLRLAGIRGVIEGGKNDG